MSELPSGTVTLLFSDMEGSTLLVRELGEAWPEVLQQQRELCREAWAAHGGHELGTEGDSFMVVFATAEAAVAAASDAQVHIAQARWPQSATVRIRIGVHTGSPMRSAEGYVGLDVHKAARVSAAAHGGQVLISEATGVLVEDALPAEHGLLDLGEHQLKDIPHRLRLLQLLGPGLERDFAPLKTHGGAGSLPALLTPTVGRDGEVGELQELLIEKQVRLINLTGPGGTGKTRLATALAASLADQYEDGIYFVPLASATSVDDMWAAMARVLDVPADGQVPPGFFDYVGQRRVILVLDNLEQIADADSVCRELLEAAPHVSIVATSRRALYVEGEHDHEVPPLPLPGGVDLDEASLDEIAASGAIQMFLDHAKRAKRTFELTPENAADVARLCSALDGLPLALELVAARVRLLSPSALLSRIDQALDLTTSDRSRGDRQRTIRGAIEWSYRLLTEPQRSVLDHLGVFEGGADLEAIESVVPPEEIAGHDLVDVLFDLVAASLVRVHDTDDGEPRFSLLETVKRFTRDQLAGNGTLSSAEARHAQLFYDRAKRLYEDEVALAQPFLIDLDNYTAVVERGAVGIVDPDWYDEGVPPLHALALLSRQAWMAGRIHVCAQWSRGALSWAETASDEAGRLSLNVTLAKALIDSGGLRDCLALLKSGRSGSSVSSGSALPNWVDVAAQTAEALGESVWAQFELGQLDDAQAALDELERLNLASGPSRRELDKARYVVAYSRGDLVEARRHLEVWMQGHPDPVKSANNLADLDLKLGHLRRAQTRLAEAASAACTQSDPLMIIIFSATFAAVIGAEHPLLCARVYGAYERARVVEALPDTSWGEAEDAEVLAAIRPLVSPEDWESAWAQGSTESLTDLLREMAALPPLRRD